jgi:hypothetical protein
MDEINKVLILMIFTQKVDHPFCSQLMIRVILNPYQGKARYVDAV